MTHHDHSGDRQLARQEYGQTDATNRAVQAVAQAFGFGHFGAGDFEGRKLNDLIDLVKDADPTELTNAGEALWKARDAISDAADELSRHIVAVDWHGESGTTFRDFGNNLASNALLLSDYADAAGREITVAGEGLSSVKNSMPPRDNRADPKTVDELPAHKRVKGDPDYDAAVKVEGHRQEAINQLVRLSSFYSVSTANLAAQEPPTFDTTQDLGVPKPSRDSVRRPAEQQQGDSLGSVSQHGDAVAKGTSHVPVHGDERTLTAHGGIDELSQRHVGTEIDSVQTVAPPKTPPGLPVDTPPQFTSNEQGPHNNPALPFTNGLQNTNQNKFPKAFGRTPSPEARGAVREPLTGNRNPTTTGRGLTQGMGRGPVGQAKATGRVPGTGRSPIMGRSPVSGGTPRAAAPGRTSQAGAVRKGGVVGGRPNAAGPVKGTTPRMPRGTVIGGRQEGAGRTPGTPAKVAQRGVIGAPKDLEKKAQPTRRTPGSPEGVVGAPKERSTGPKGERAGFTTGGSGLVRGQENQRHTGQHGPEHRDEAGHPRPWDPNGVEQPGHPQRPPHAPPAND